MQSPATDGKQPTVIDVEGYLLSEACRFLQQAGYQVAEVATGNPRPYPIRVLRQRQLDDHLIELTQACELYSDPGVDDREAKDGALQDK
jgi:hypothetical protein